MPHLNTSLPFVLGGFPLSLIHALGGLTLYSGEGVGGAQDPPQVYQDIAIVSGQWRVLVKGFGFQSVV